MPENGSPVEGRVGYVHLNGMVVTDQYYKEVITDRYRMRDLLVEYIRDFGFDEDGYPVCTWDEARTYIRHVFPDYPIERFNRDIWTLMPPFEIGTTLSTLRYNPSYYPIIDM